MCAGLCVLLRYIFCKSGECGWSFSLSLSKLYPYSEDAGVLIGARRQNCQVASLADIGWIDRDDDEEEDDDEGYIGRPG